MKVFSWEPLICHDTIDIGWSKLANLNIHEGKLLACSYNQSCVGIWVVDLLQVGPYASGTVPRSNKLAVEKLNSNGHLGVKQSVDASGKNSNVARPSSSHGLESGLREATLTSSIAAFGSAPGTPQRAGSGFTL